MSLEVVKTNTDLLLLHNPSAKVGWE